MNSYRQLLVNGLATNNPALIQMLGLCPLLAVTTTLAYSLGLGVATLAVLVCSNALISMTRRITASHVRIPVYVLVISGLVTAVDMIMSAWYFDLHRVLGIFVPLIVTNCLIIARAEAFASRNSLSQSLVDGFAHGAGFALVLLVMGFMRELIGHGTLFAHMSVLFGEQASDWQINVHSGWLLFILPPGAFLALAFLIAGYKSVSEKFNPLHTTVAQAKTIEPSGQAQESTA